MRTVRECAQELMSIEQLACGRKCAYSLLHHIRNQIGLYEVDGNELCHLVVTQCDSGYQGTICIHQELSPLAKEVSHFAIARLVANGNHALALCKKWAYACYAWACRPILRSLISHLRPRSDKSSTLALPVAVQSVCTTMGSIEPVRATWHTSSNNLHTTCKGENMDTQESAEWHRQLRQGALSSFSHFRRLLKQGSELSADDRQGLVDMLNYTEEHMVAMWQIEDMA